MRKWLTLCLTLLCLMLPCWTDEPARAESECPVTYEQATQIAYDCLSQLWQRPVTQGDMGGTCLPGELMGADTEDVCWEVMIQDELMFATVLVNGTTGQVLQWYYEDMEENVSYRCIRPGPEEITYDQAMEVAVSRSQQLLRELDIGEQNLVGDLSSYAPGVLFDQEAIGDTEEGVWLIILGYGQDSMDVVYFVYLHGLTGQVLDEELYSYRTDEILVP